LLPKSVLGNVSRSGKSDSYILETSEVDVKEGWMRTESRNLDWTGILSVVERQRFGREGVDVDIDGLGNVKAGTTGVITTVMFRSRLGERLRARATVAKGEEGKDVVGKEEAEPKKGFLASWSTAGIQRSIEVIASRRTVDQMGKSKEGMTVVLERLRSGGLVGVLDGMRRDHETVLATAE